MTVELFLSYDEHLDWLTLIEFGQVENAQPRDHWRGVSESFGYLLRHPEGPEIGFKILDFSKFYPEDPEVSEIWAGPRFEDSKGSGMLSVLVMYKGDWDTRPAVGFFNLAREQGYDLPDKETEDIFWAKQLEKSL